MGAERAQRQGAIESFPAEKMTASTEHQGAVKEVRQSELGVAGLMRSQVGD
jgi:hypothetical protein